MRAFRSLLCTDSHPLHSLHTRTPFFSFSKSTSFPDWELSFQGFAGLVGALCGALVYARYLSHRKIKAVFTLSCLLATAMGATQLIFAAGVNESWLGISDKVFVPVDSIIVSFFGRISMMPTLVLAAQR